MLLPTRALARALIPAGASLLAPGVRSAPAAALQASPVLIEMTEKAPSTVATIRNTGTDPLDVQTLVMRWAQSEGAESPDEANEVIASPPMTALKPGTNYAVRIVRAAKGSISSEEAYRVFVDQLPEADRQKNGTVALVMRHSIPAFLSNGENGQPKVTWQLGSTNGRLSLRATNTGMRLLRLANVSLKIADVRRVVFGNGSLGYVLAGSTMEWRSNVSAYSGSATLIATTDLGPLTTEAHGSR